MLSSYRFLHPSSLLVHPFHVHGQSIRMGVALAAARFLANQHILPVTLINLVLSRGHTMLYSGKLCARLSGMLFSAMDEPHPDVSPLLVSCTA